MKKGSFLKSILMIAVAVAITFGGIAAVKANKVEAATNGWVQSGGNWYYYVNGTRKTGWFQNAGNWYYLSDDDGSMLTGMQVLPDQGDYYTFYFDQNGHMRTGWVSEWLDFYDGTGITQWHYYDARGHKVVADWVRDSNSWYYIEWVMQQNCWYQVDNTWYYFDNSGRMAKSGYQLTGWQQMNGYWFYFTSAGQEAHGWKKISNKWYYFEPYESNGSMSGWMYFDGLYEIDGDYYYFDASGAMKTGWVKVEGEWMYFGSNGARVEGWIKDGGNWYFCWNFEQYDSTYGYYYYEYKMLVGWYNIDDDWYYFQPSGVMSTGWTTVDGDWHYFGTNGAEVYGWQYINNNWYYFNDDGIMLHNTYVGGYYLGSNGARQ